MSEQEWLAATDPMAMLHQIRSSNNSRKLRLWACAVCRMFLPLDDETGNRELAAAVETAERFADGLADADELVGASVCSVGEGYWSVADVDAFRAAEMVAQDEELQNRRAELCELLRDVAGNPFRTVLPLSPTASQWHGGLVKRLAEEAYERRTLPAGTLDKARLSVLADALEEAGCDSHYVLAHLRAPGSHCRGCFAVDWVLGRS